MVWVPCAASLLLTLLSLPHLLWPSAKRKLIWTVSSLARIVLHGLALLLSMGLLLLAFFDTQAGDQSWTLFTARLVFAVSLTGLVCALIGELSLGGALSPYLTTFAAAFILLYSALETACQLLENVYSRESGFFLAVSACLLLGFISLAFRIESEEGRSSAAVRRIPSHGGVGAMYGIEEAIPELHRSGLNRLFLDWVTPLVRLGYKRPLVQEDLYRVKPRDESKAAFLELHRNMETEFRPVVEAARSERAVRAPSIMRVIFKTYGWELVTSGILNLFSDLSELLEPIVLKLMISYAATPDEPAWHGIVYLLLMFGGMLLRNLFTQHYILIQAMMGMRFKTGFVSAIYRKALALSQTARSKFTVGEIVNLMSVDAGRMSDVADVIHLIWSCPLMIAIVLTLLYYTIGYAAFAGAGVYVALIPINAIFSHLYEKYQEKQMEEKDNRIKLLTELLNGIKLLKLYAWEPAFQRQLGGIRKKEIGWIRNNAVINGILEFCWTSSTLLAATATFIAYVAMGGQMTAEKIFVTFALFDKINMPVSLLPMAVSYILMLLVSLRRLAKFFSAAELQSDSVPHVPNSDHAISLHNATFSWGKGARPKPHAPEPHTPSEEEMRKEEAVVLRDISMTVNDSLMRRGREVWRVEVGRGALVGVVGRVGSGKSSLLSALCGELDRLGGDASLCGETAYVPQTAWIQNLTLRDNILFGEAMDPDRYKMVTSACSLGPDLDILPNGDQTEIGERGINLSGGQKARVSLARAVYRSSPSIYLLDDPLSALDVHVGKSIFQQVIGPNGILREKCRVLVTHSLWVLSACDWVVCLSEGEVAEQGEYAHLLTRGGNFASLIGEFLNAAPDQEIQDMDAKVLEQLSSSPVTREVLQKRRSRITSQMSAEGPVSSPKASVTDGLIDRLSTPVGSPSKTPILGRFVSDTSVGSNLSRQSSQQESKAVVESDTARLIDDEEVHTGRVVWSVYKAYLSECGWYVFFYAIWMVLGEACWTGANIWLQVPSPLPNSDRSKPGVVEVWADHSPHENNASVAGNWTIQPVFGVGVFSSIAGGQAISIIVLRIFFIMGFVQASQNIHDRLTKAIFRAPISFFETTPTGRIVNRCGKDLEIVDDQLPGAVDMVAVCILWTVESVGIVCYALPWFLVALLPILVVYAFILRFYVTTSRQLRRLMSVARSPIYTSFQETLAGASSIRAYNAVPRFVGITEHLVDENNRAQYANIAANRWLGCRLSLLANCLASAAAALIVYARWSGTGISPGVVGLGLSNALLFMGILSFCVRQIARLETEIVAVERIKEYSQVPPEASWDLPQGALPPPQGWPTEGKINFDNYGIRYRPGLDLALRDINCTIRGGEKVGIVGRTGAGKSSLASGLFRLMEPATGEIRIDGHPTSALGLHTLRSNLSIIPQDPLVFSGSLRLNLDPHDNYPDSELWEVLELSHLKEFASGPRSLRLGLEVSEGGSDLSQGQRQLLCLARALLRRAKILVLDEATGAVDVETDALVQKTLKEAFPQATILTIAHRLNTILHSHRIMVLEAGSIVELDTPAALLANPTSRFAQMCAEAGISAQ